MRIILDMDEVLADFVGGACRAWGVEESKVLENWPVGEWDMVPPLSRALGLEKTMSVDQFWEPLNTEEFWRTLQPLPWAKELVNLVTGLTDDWHVVSAPPSYIGAHIGKIRWLQSFFGSSFNYASDPLAYLGRYTLLSTSSWLENPACSIKDSYAHSHS